MTKNLESKSFNFEVIDWQNGLIKVPSNILNQLNKDKSLSVTISESSEDLLVKHNISKEVFNKIKEVQDLPDEVIINFILCESSLSSTDFKLKDE
jgi:hypothetical protein